MPQLVFDIPIPGKRRMQVDTSFNCANENEIIVLDSKKIRRWSSINTAGSAQFQSDQAPAEGFVWSIVAQHKTVSSGGNHPWIPSAGQMLQHTGEKLVIGFEDSPNPYGNNDFDDAIATVTFV